MAGARRSFQGHSVQGGLISGQGSHAPTSKDFRDRVPALCCRPWKVLHSPQDSANLPQVKKHKVVKPRGRRGFGGAWRAFVRKNSLGQRGSPDFRVLAGRYNAGAEGGQVDIEELQRVGKAARVAGKLNPPRPGHSAFGPKGRQMQRRALTDLRAALTDFAKSLDKENRAWEVGERASSTGQPLQICLSLARSALRATSLHDRRAREQLLTELQAYENGPGKEMLDRLRQEHTWLANFDLRPLPTPKGVLVEALPGDGGGEVLERAIAWAHGTKASKLSSGLRESWAEMHRTLLEDECGDFKDVPVQVSECLTAGVCLCCESGKELKRLRNNFLGAMKRAFKCNSPQGSALGGGSIVVRMLCSPRDGDYEAIVEADNPFAELFFHVGLMYWKPYRPTFLQLERATDPSAPDACDGKIYVKAK